MGKHRAIIVGAGRIGTGFNWPATPYVYTHADAYRALADRVELVGVVEPDQERRDFATKKYGVKGWVTIKAAIAYERPDIVSICTLPEQHCENLVECLHDGLLGVWMEKPLNIDGREALMELTALGLRIQVNYIRRFDSLHREVLESGDTQGATLSVWAKTDVHTVCHFTDLARWWGIGKGQLAYVPHDGPCSYLLANRDRTRHFPKGGVVGGFMEAALGNLLDAVEGKAALVSPPESAVQSEKWANEILEAK